VVGLAITWRILVPNCLEHALARYRIKPSNWDQWMEAFLGWEDSRSIESNPGNWDQWMETFLGWEDSPSIESNPAIGISGWRPFWAGRTHTLSNQTRAIGFSLAARDGGLSELGGLTVYPKKLSSPSSSGMTLYLPNLFRPEGLKLLIGD